MGRLSLSPRDYEEVRTFLNDTTPVHVDGLQFVPQSAGLALQVQYRDERGQTHKKTLSTPENYHMAMVDLAVMMSEWLSHGSTRASDIAKVN
jgi:hypothetical protein